MLSEGSLRQSDRVHESLEPSPTAPGPLLPSKRLAALAAGAVLCLTALAGCGGGGSGTEAAGTAATASSSDGGTLTDTADAGSSGGDFTSASAAPPADFELFDGTKYAAIYTEVLDPTGARVSGDCTDQLGGVAGTSVFSATCDFYTTKSGSFMVSTLIVTGAESETWIQCRNTSGGYSPLARLRGSQYGQTKVFDADAKTAVLLGLSASAGPTFYTVTGGSGEQCFSIKQIGTGKDGETASSGLAHAWVATDTGTPGWCISAKAGEWLIAKSAADACPPA